MDHAVDRCDLPDRAGHFLPDINVYAISNFLPSSFVLDFFFFVSNCSQLNSLQEYLFYVYNILTTQQIIQEKVKIYGFFKIKFIVIIYFYP